MKWKTNTTEFPVSLSFANGSWKATIPKPVYEHLEEPKEITFIIEEGEVKISV